MVPTSTMEVFFGKKQPQRVILTYHDVSREPAPTSVSGAQLRSQLAWAMEHYEIVALGELVKGLQDEPPLKRNQLAVTFDDGYRSFLDCALPILVDLRIHSTLFVPAAKVGGFNDWDAGKRGYPKLPLLTFNDLRTLPEDLVEIGSHGLRHLPLNRVPPDILEKEVKDSRSILEHRLGRSVTLFSFPHGYHCDEGRRNNRPNGRQLLEEAGYHAACTMRWGRFNSTRDVFALRRAAIWPGDTLKDFENKLGGYYDWLVLKESFARWLRKKKYGFKPQIR